MAVRGQRPKPAHLKLVTGNPGHRGDPEQLAELEPKPEGEIVKPRHVKGRASAIWDQYAPEVIRLGLLTPLDVHNFALWCRLAAKSERALDKMSAADMTQFRVLGGSFGIGADARARIGADIGKHLKRDGAKQGEQPQRPPASKWFKD